MLYEFYYGIRAKNRPEPGMITKKNGDLLYWSGMTHRQGTLYNYA